MPEQPSNTTKAAHAMGTATAYCPRCQAANRPGSEGRPDVVWIDRRDDGMLECRCCAHGWWPTP